MLDRQSREVRVRGEVARRTESSQQPEQDSRVPLTRMDQKDLWLSQPSFRACACRARAHRVREDSRVGGDPDEPEDDDPGET